MGKYKYLDSERKTNKVLKMQEQQLESLLESTEQNSTNLQEIRKILEEKLRAKGINPSSISQKDTVSESSYIKVDRGDIPDWKELEEAAESKYIEDVTFEDLLSKEEFQFCVDEIERINEEFASATGIFNKVDMSFLMVATALQTARWLIIQSICGDIGESIDGATRLAHDDKSIKDSINRSNKRLQSLFEKHGHMAGSKKYKSWEQIIFSSAPYDTTVGSPKFGENLGGKYHRYKTLGHDPILGWIFGTANFITDTCTLSNFNSYRITREGRPHFSESISLATIFYEVFDSVKEDWLRLPAGIFAQYIHLKSDIFTVLGLPVPVIETFSEALAGKLYRSQYDSLCLLKDVMIVGNQAAWSIIINMIIGLVHGFFYNPQKDGDRTLYEVRTRKILAISNSLASAGNIAYAVGTEDWHKLDVGGIMVTMYRLFTDIRFVTRVKKEFIEKEMDKVLDKEMKELDSYFD